MDVIYITPLYRVYSRVNLASCTAEALRMRDGHQRVARYPDPCQVRSPKAGRFSEWLMAWNGARPVRGGGTRGPHGAPASD